MSKEKVFSITIGGTSELDCRCPMRHVACRVSIITSNNGILLQKSSNDRKILSMDEPDELKFIPQVTTKMIDSIKMSSSVFKWNEEFKFNELFSHISQKNVIFLFEIIDFTIYEGKHNFVPLAWGYLKLFNKDGKIVNANSQRNIQLYEYPPNFPLFPTTQAIPTFKLLPIKKPISTILSVCVKEIDSDETTITNERPVNPFQKEMGDVDLAELIENEEEEDLSVDIQEEGSTYETSLHCLIPRKLKTQIYPGDHGALCLRFNHAGTVLAAGIQKERNFFIDLFSTDTFKIIDSWAAHIDNIYDLQFSNDDTKILSASGDGTVKLWNVEKPRKPIILPHAKFIYAARFHPLDNNFIFTAGFDGIIRVWDIKQMKNFKELRGHKARINTMTFSPNGRRLFAGDVTGAISVWRTVIENGNLCLSSKKIVRDDEIGSTPIVHLEMVRSNLSLLVQTQDDIIRVFDTKAMTTAQRYVGAKCQRYIMQSTFSPDGAYVLSGSEDGNVLLWTVRVARSANVQQWDHKFTCPVTSVAWNPKMNMVAFSSFGDNQPILIYVDPTPIFDPTLAEEDEELVLGSDKSDQY